MLRLLPSSKQPLTTFQLQSLGGTQMQVCSMKEKEKIKCSVVKSEYNVRKKDASLPNGEPKGEIKGADPPDGYGTWSNSNEVLASIEDGNTMQSLVAEEGIDISYPGTSGGQPMVSHVTGPGIWLGKVLL